MERIVLLATEPKDVVLDCFAGSGSTLVACKLHGRSFIGIEQSPEYCAISKARLSSHPIPIMLEKKRSLLTT